MTRLPWDELETANRPQLTNAGGSLAAAAARLYISYISTLCWEHSACAAALVHSAVYSAGSRRGGVGRVAALRRPGVLPGARGPLEGRAERRGTVELLEIASAERLACVEAPYLVRLRLELGLGLGLQG